MPSDREGLLLGALDLNDGVGLTLEALTFKPAAKKPQWVDNPDADGEVLVGEAHYTNAYFEGRLRIEPQADMDAALDLLGSVTEAFQLCERLAAAGGQAVPWTAAGSERTWTWYAELAEYTDLPTELTGDLAGWFLSSPVIPFKLTCRPFGHGERKRILAPTSYTGPLQAVVLDDPGGDVDAEGEAILTDKAGKDRRHAEWGLELVDETSPPALLLDSDSLVTTGFAGAQAERVGAYDPNASGNNVIKATAVSLPVVLCGTGDIAHVGSYRVKPRVYAASTNARYRASYRVADGPLRSLSWVTPPVVGTFAELNLGEAVFDRVDSGLQRSEVRIEVMSAGANTPTEVDFLILIPTGRGYGRARGLASNKPTNLLVWDEFDQSAGNLDAPKALPLPAGQNWSEASKTGANGMQINATSHVAQRTTVSDASRDGGCFAIAGTSNYTNVSAGALVSASYVGPFTGSGSPTIGSEMARFGVMARYASPEKWLVAALTYASPAAAGGLYLVVLKRTGASAAVVLNFGLVSFGGTLVAPRSLQLTVDVGGFWTASVPNLVTFSGQDGDLATGGALATGKVGLYDAWTGAEANTRVYDNFNVTGLADAGRVCFATRHLQLRADEDEVIRQDAAGEDYGPPDFYRGSRIYIPPRLDTGQVARLAAKMRVNDTDTEADSSIADKQELEVWATPRVLVPR